jgi:hypothetical protein
MFRIALDRLKQKQQTRNEASGVSRTTISHISGGNNVVKWETSVYALVKRQSQFRQDNEQYKWDKFPLYQGKGLSAIVPVASGLLACVPHYPNSLTDFGNRLGPTVGRVYDKVFKAFDIKTSHKSNIDVIKLLLDEMALLWKSKYINLEIG